jgi:hypothetical protein
MTPNRVSPAHAASKALASVALLGIVLLGGPLAPISYAATITIVNNDNPNEGFNDGTAAAPVGGNPGTTIGAQRLFVFQQAAAIWGAMLKSNVVIRVNAQFNPLSCDAVSGVLGSAGPTTVHRDFTGALFSGTWYHQALANKLAGSDLSAAQNDINATFNSSVGSPTCLTIGWYYGIDGNEGSQIELLPVVLHEIGHGLGFSTTTNGQTGVNLNSFPHVWDHFLFDPSVGLHWNEMNNAQRAASAVSCGNLVWDGDLVTHTAPTFLAPGPNLRVNSPPIAAGDYEVGQASFGSPLTESGVTGDVVLANDGVGVVTNACEPLVNVVAGKIVLLDRGDCTFVVKVKNAQNAGAIGVVVADNVAGCPPAGLGGDDPTITIPSVRVSQSDGTFLKANLVGMNATLLLDPTKRAGADAAGRALLYAPNPYTPGSSVSHYDVSAEPNLLMEPGINSSLSSDTDLTLHLFADIGWLGASSAVADASETQGIQFSLAQNQPNPGSAFTHVRFSIPARERVVLRVFDVNGRLVLTPVDAILDPGPHSARIPTSSLAGGVYFYRLEGGGKSLSRRFAVLP